jgi:hypothetical protein
MAKLRKILQIMICVMSIYANESVASTEDSLTSSIISSANSLTISGSGANLINQVPASSNLGSSQINSSKVKKKKKHIGERTTTVHIHIIPNEDESDSSSSVDSKENDKEHSSSKTNSKYVYVPSNSGIPIKKNMSAPELLSNHSIYSEAPIDVKKLLYDATCCYNQNASQIMDYYTPLSASNIQPYLFSIMESYQSIIDILKKVGCNNETERAEQTFAAISANSNSNTAAMTAPKRKGRSKSLNTSSHNKIDTAPYYPSTARKK